MNPACFRRARKLIRGMRGLVNEIYLLNELCVGRYVWNRSRWTKDPDTGRRVRFARPRTEWQIEQRDDLRILDDAAWYAARRRMSTPRREGGRAGPGRTPSTLFGGILRCGLCGSAMVKVDARDYGCAAREDRGPAVCVGLAVRLADVDRILTEHLRSLLSSPATIAEIDAMVRGIVSERRRARQDGDKLDARREALGREISRLADAIAEAGSSRALVERLVKAESELEALKLASPRDKMELHPAAIGPGVRAMISDLSASLRRNAVDARAALHAAFGTVRLLPEDLVPQRHTVSVPDDDLKDPKRQGNRIPVYAEIESAAERLAFAVGGTKINRVAGTGFEPVTFGL
jgi:site-specific DNA recombinase